MVLLRAGRIAGEGEATRRNRSRSDRVDFPIDPLHGCHDQLPPGEVFGIVEGGNQDIDGLAIAGERRKIGGDRHHAQVVGFLRGIVAESGANLRIDAESVALNEVQRELPRDRAFATGAIESRHQPEPHQLIRPHAFDFGEVANADFVGRADWDVDQQRENESHQEAAIWLSGDHGSGR